MTGRRGRTGRWALLIFTAIWLAVLVPLSAAAAPYAAMVMDARSGKVLHSSNADTPLHPASLTKMMTLYIAFEAVQNGELSMDTLVTVSRLAASEPPSKLGLREGQRIKLRYLVRAAAVRSANDAATAIAEAISGSEAAFAARMNATARAMGMTRTNFHNAHGLTQSGHLSTARDMTILGRHMIYDYPMYYNLFSRESTDAGVATVYHTNRKFLRAYQGADGIKTGYTRAAGFNLTATAQRGSERVIATVFGGNSVASRNAQMAELLDLGFSRAPTQVALRRPSMPPYRGNTAVAVLRDVDPAPGHVATALRKGHAAVEVSLRPRPRPVPAAAVVAALTETLPPSAAVPETAEAPAVAEQAPVAGSVPATQTVEAAPAAAPPADTAAVTATVAAGLAPETSVKPVLRPGLVAQAAANASAPPPAGEVVSRLSTSGERHWGINIGRYPSRFAAEKVLLRTALAETATLDGALRKVVQGARGFDANFHGLTRETAELACRRLQARQISCFMIGPS